MKITQKKYTPTHGWETLKDQADHCSLVLGFGSTSLLSDPSLYELIKKDYPDATILLCSTAGEIHDTQVNDDSLSLIAIQFEHTRIIAKAVSTSDFENSFQAGYGLASKLPSDGLRNVILFSDGHEVNGSELILALNQFLSPEVLITGGMAGDGARFQTTLVGLNEAPRAGRIAAIGFYGDRLKIGSGTRGGWDPFGVERLVTRSENNVLFELDGKPALDVYKLYLGEYAKELPGSALLFPLSIRVVGADYPLVRTILSINESDKSLTFAGNIPQGAYAQLMKANFDRLIDGAAIAADLSCQGGLPMPELAILISCVGRRLVLGQRVEEELESIRSVYGEATVLTGFYSYGEFSPAGPLNSSELHNQTMTITVLSEA